MREISTALTLPRLFALPILAVGMMLPAPPMSQAAPPLKALSQSGPAPKFLEDEAEPQFNLAFTARPSAAGSLSVVFDHRDAKNFYALALAPQSLALRATVNGVPRLLAQSPIAWKNNSQVVLKRRRWVMEVIVDGRVALTAYDATFDSGQIGSTTTGGWKWLDARVQPVEEIYFADDFTRLPGENGEWKPGGGRWTLTSSSEESAALRRTRNSVAERIEMSANPFAYRAQSPSGEAFTRAGRWFWDNYEASVAVKPMSAGAVGLAVYVQDEKNYLAFVWNATEGPQARQLVRVVDGKSTVLARSAGAYLPRQWYRLSVRTSPGYVETFIDGAPVFKANNDFFGQGGIALLTRNVRATDFDDARVTSYAHYRQNFAGAMGSAATGAAATGSAWTPAGGVWNTRDGLLLSAPQAGDSGASRFLLTGRSDWDGYSMTASARAGKTGAAGLVVGYLDDKNYTVFRWAGASSKLPFRGRQQLLRWRDGKARIISNEPLSVGARARDGFAQVTMHMASGAVAVRADGHLIAQMADETLVAGRPALWAQGAAPAAFRDVVMFFPPPPVAPKVAPKMADDALMVGWASPSGEWPPLLDGSGEYWNTGEFFGDAMLSYDWRRANYAGGTLELALRARRAPAAANKDGITRVALDAPKNQKTGFHSGYVARFEDLKDKGALRVTLLRGAATLKQAEFDWNKLAGAGSDAATARPVSLRVQMEGRGLLFSVAGKPVLTYTEPGTRGSGALGGTAFAARSSGFRLRASELRASSEHRDDYTFTEAPTDWYAPQGEWSVISRWPCYGDWSFFGGAGLNPALWTKRTYAGDVVVEFYSHNQMDLPKQPGYSAPGNMNVTIGGDGKNPSSGYSFVVAGWNNTRTRILKGSQVVAENTSEVSYLAKPSSHNAKFHKSWLYVRAEARRARKNGRDGVNLLLLVDDMPICEYFDAEPLPSLKTGGRVALWTLDGVMMVARAKIESERMGTLALPAGLLDPTAQPSLTLAAGGAANSATGVAAGGDALVPRPVYSDGLASSIVSGGDGAWTVSNPASGGLFAVQLQKGGVPTMLRATPATRLEMDVAIPAAAKVDLYVTVDGVPHLIGLGGTARPDARVRSLGMATMTPALDAPTEALKGDEAWRHVAFDLGAALQKMYPAAREWQVENIQIGALHGDEYRWLGFDGNLLGTTYQLRGARLTNAANRVATGAAGKPGAASRQ